VQHISSISKSCFLTIRDLRRIRKTIDQTTACTIATSLIHSKIDYCNSLLRNLPATQTNRLQLVLISAARAVTETPKFHHITPILKSLHWLKINERIKYKLVIYFSKTGQLRSYLRSLLSFPSHRCTRSFSFITLSRPSLTYCFKIANRSFYVILLLFYGTISHLIRQVFIASHFLLFYTRLCLIFQPLFSLRS